MSITITYVILFGMKVLRFEAAKLSINLFNTLHVGETSNYGATLTVHTALFYVLIIIKCISILNILQSAKIIAGYVRIVNFYFPTYPNFVKLSSGCKK